MNKDEKIIKKQFLKRLGFFLYSSYSIIARGFHLIIKPKPKKINLHGKQIFIYGNLQYLFFWGKNYEKNTYKIFDKLLDSNHSYIDIGAFIGSTVLYGATIAKKVYAIEPDPIAFAELIKNVSLNPKLKEKIELHQKCINDKSGKVRFGNIAKGGDSTSSLQFADSNTSWIVDGITFESFIEKNNISNCNFIKMDIEGGETIVLPTMVDYLEKNKPILYLSMHPIFFKNPIEDTKKIIEVLKMYKNIYTDAGKKIEFGDLLSKKRIIGRYAIVAMDREFDEN
jgi:FkbM family methyltransferase